MTRQELEQRKRLLEEQRQAGHQLVEASYYHQLRTLELAWMAASLGAGSSLEIPMAAAPQLPPPAPAASIPTPLPEPRRRRRSAWELFDAVAQALDRVPEVFDRNDICREIGETPDRASLYRTFRQLLAEGAIVLLQRGSGNIPTTYRKTGVSYTSNPKSC
jgi:hypothetical protein